jgi:hypothetical protein
MSSLEALERPRNSDAHSLQKGSAMIGCGEMGRVASAKFHSVSIETHGIHFSFSHMQRTRRSSKYSSI